MTRLPGLDALLALGEAEKRVVDLRHVLELLPQEEARIDAEERGLAEELAAARKGVKDLEVRRQAEATERQGLEEKVVRLKTQQMSLRKQEEFDAIQREIDHANADIGALEDKELGDLMEIDVARAALAATETRLREAGESVRRRRAEIAVRRGERQAELAAAEAALAAARGAALPAHVEAWDRTRRLVKRGPWVVVLQEGHRCAGCHLRVSNEIVGVVLRGERLASCDQCSRLLVAP